MVANCPIRHSHHHRDRPNCDSTDHVEVAAVKVLPGGDDHQQSVRFHCNVKSKTEELTETDRYCVVQSESDDGVH